MGCEVDVPIRTAAIRAWKCLKRLPFYRSVTGVSNWAHQARFIVFNTSGHAAERPSDGSNARIMRGMTPGSAVRPLWLTTRRPARSPSSQKYHSESDGSSVRVTSEGDEQKLGSVCLPVVGKCGRDHADAVRTPGRARHRLLRALHRFCMLVPTRVK